jgi:ABC-2 type transport system permease protein
VQSLEQQFNVFSGQPLNQLSVIDRLDTLDTERGFVGFAVDAISGLLRIILLLVVLNYAHACLFEDRKNREILFWRSMPVSETQNLGAKLAIIYGFAPVSILVLGVCGGFVCWLVAWVFGVNALAALPLLIAPFKSYGQIMLMLAVMMPMIVWMLFSSAYAKKSPFMVGAFLPLGLMLADRLVMWATGINLYIREGIYAYGRFLVQFTQAPGDAFFSGAMFLVVLVSGLLIAATIWLRNNRYEI